MSTRKSASDFFENETNLESKEENKKGELQVNELGIIKEKNTEYSPDEKDNATEDADEKGNDSKLIKEPTQNSNQQIDNVQQYHTLTPEQQLYYAQYSQYMQQYQQYYASQLSPAASTTQSSLSDPVYDYYTGTTETTIPPVSFESTRANRQMQAYFDPTKFQAVLSPEMQSAQRAQKEQQQAKLTAKDIEKFKKRKIEKKKGKNRWFYE